MKRAFIFGCILLAGCVSYADPDGIRAPQTTAEWAAYKQGSQRAEPVRRRLETSNQDICKDHCDLNILMGIASGIGAFYDYNDGSIWLPIPMVEATRNDDELALVIAHEWAHGLLQHKGDGFSVEKELTAECVGTLIATRSGFDPLNGSNLHARMSGREDAQMLVLAAFGVFGGGTKLDWSQRISTIRTAANAAAGREITPDLIRTVCDL